MRSNRELLQGSLLQDMLIAVEQFTTRHTSILRLPNPISPQGGSNAQVHHVGLQRWLDLLAQMDAAELYSQTGEIKTQLEQLLGELEQNTEERSSSREYSAPLYERMQLVKIPAGQITIGENVITMPYSFMVMATPVTQGHWTEIMGNNPSYFAGRPNYPVENMTWSQAIIFANELSKKEGLEPVYIFDAERELKDSDITSILHPNNSGYQLMTAREWSYVLALAERENGIVDSDNFMEYIRLQTDHTTHTVACCRPLLVGGQKLYDVHGNVREWILDDQEPFIASFGYGWMAHALPTLNNFGVILQSFFRTYLMNFSNNEELRTELYHRSPPQANPNIGLRLMRRLE